MLYRAVDAVRFYCVLLCILELFYVPVCMLPSWLDIKRNDSEDYDNDEYTN